MNIGYYIAFWKIVCKLNILWLFICVQAKYEILGESLKYIYLYVAIAREEKNIKIVDQICNGYVLLYNFRKSEIFSIFSIVNSN